VNTGFDSIDLRISKKFAVLFREPFWVIESSPYLPPAFYSSLAASFPIEALRMQIKGGRLHARIDKDHDVHSLEELLTKSLEWRQLLSWFESKEFRRDAVKFLGEAIARRARPRYQRIYRFFLGTPLFKYSVSSSITLSTSGYHLTPHTDSTTKVLALILYFADVGQGAPRQCGTRYWKTEAQFDSMFPDSSSAHLGQHQLPRRLRTSDSVPEFQQFSENAEIFYQSDFVPNCVSGFVKSRDSWHDLSIPESESTLERCALLVNIHLSNSRVVLLDKFHRIMRKMRLLGDMS
jgi:hypothetical protein